MKLKTINALATLAFLLAGRQMAPAQSQPPGPDEYDRFSAFIANRNIFDPNRVPHSPKTPRHQHQKRPKNTPAPAFSFVGAMAYNKGMFAFFDGNNADYSKALQVSGTIAGYTVRDIGLTGVKLEAGGTSLFLPLGWQMRQEADGTWRTNDDQSGFANQGESSVSAGPADSSATPAPAPTGPMSDVLKRLMQKRQQENK